MRARAKTKRSEERERSGTPALANDLYAKFMIYAIAPRVLFLHGRRRRRQRVLVADHGGKAHKLPHVWCCMRSRDDDDDDEFSARGFGGRQEEGRKIRCGFRVFQCWIFSSGGDMHCEKIRKKNKKKWKKVKKNKYKKQVFR